MMTFRYVLLSTGASNTPTRQRAILQGFEGARALRGANDVTGRYPTAPAVYMPVKGEPCFVAEQTCTEQVHSIFLGGCKKPPVIL
jgi:hypothetical protein